MDSNSVIFNTFNEEKPEGQSCRVSSFHNIEDYCMNYILKERVYSQEYEKFKKVMDLKKPAISSKFYPADEYYTILNRLGFELPPLYIKNE